MDGVSGSLVVFLGVIQDRCFEGILERRLFLCEVVFGVELKDCLIYHLILKEYYQLRLSPVIATNVKSCLEFETNTARSMDADVEYEDKHKMAIDFEAIIRAVENGDLEIAESEEIVVVWAKIAEKYQGR